MASLAAQPSVFDPNLPKLHHGEHGVIENFTATGRPFNPAQAQRGSGVHALNSADAMCLDAPDILPRRYTDDSLISIPVLPSDSVNAIKIGSATSSPTTPTYSVYNTISGDDDPVKHDTSSGFKFWKSRKPSMSTHTSGSNGQGTARKGKKDKAGVDFVMKKVSRGDYLKHYAKDEQGRYTGSEEPATDCILRDEADVLKWRRGATQWKNEI